MDGFLVIKGLFFSATAYTFYKIYSSVLILQEIYHRDENFTFDDDFFN